MPLRFTLVNHFVPASLLYISSFFPFLSFYTTFFTPYQSHSRNSSLESGVTLIKFKSEITSQNGGQRVATPTGTLDSALSGSHNVIFQDKDDDDGKHSRNLIVFFGLICFIIGLVLVFLMLLSGFFEK